MIPRRYIQVAVAALTLAAGLPSAARQQSWEIVTKDDAVERGCSSGSRRAASPPASGRSPAQCAHR
jgi:hypothetical protein